MSVKHSKFFCLFLFLFLSRKCLILANNHKTHGLKQKGITRRHLNEKPEDKKDEGEKNLWEKYKNIWIALICVAALVIIGLIIRHFKARKDPTVKVDNTSMHQRRRLRSNVSGRFLSRKLHSEIKKHLKHGLKGVRDTNSLFKPETRNRFYRVYEVLSHQICHQKADRKLFVRKFPKMLKFFTHKANHLDTRNLGLRSMFSSLTDYFKEHENIDLRKNKMIALSSISKVLSRTSTIIKAFNRG